jgi:hypothetical protein
MYLTNRLNLGVSCGFMALKDVLPDTNLQIRVMLLPALCVLPAINLLLKICVGQGPGQDFHQMQSS